MFKPQPPAAKSPQGDVEIMDSPSPEHGTTVEPPQDPWLEVVRRHEDFLARRREAGPRVPGAGPSGESLFWCSVDDEQDRAA